MLDLSFINKPLINRLNFSLLLLKAEFILQIFPKIKIFTYLIFKEKKSSVYIKAISYNFL